METIRMVGDENLRFLLQNRMESLLAMQEGTPDWAIEIADQLDELGWLGAVSEADRLCADRVHDILSNALREAGGEIIDEDVWDPARQRAVSIAAILPAGAAPRIAAKHASGVVLQGRLLRKQEVTLQKAP